MLITTLVPSSTSLTGAIANSGLTGSGVGGTGLAVTVNVTLASPAVKFSLASEITLTVFSPTTNLSAETP